MTTTASLPETPLSPDEMNDPLVGTLCHELRKTSSSVMSAMSGEFARWDLKPSEATLLKYVGANPGCTQSDIARAHRNKATNLVPLIARLERDGLLERVPGDGRTIALTISAKGRDVLAEVETSFARLEQGMAQHLSAEQRDFIVEALRIIRRNACIFREL